MKDKDETGIVFDRDLSKPDPKMKKRMKKPKKNSDLDQNQSKLKESQVQENNSKPDRAITIPDNQLEDNKPSSFHTPTGKGTEKLILMNVEKKYDEPRLQSKMSDKEKESLQKESVDDEDQNDWINNSNKIKTEPNVNINNNGESKSSKSKQNKTPLEEKSLKNNSNIKMDNNNSNNDNSNLKYKILKCHKECNEMSKLIEELSSKIDSNNMKIDQSEYNLQLDTLRGEIAKKEKIIQSLNQTNNKQREALEILSKQIDEKLIKANMNRKHPQYSQHQTANNSSKDIMDNPYSKEMKIKEKELKNAIALIEILSKDNAQLKASLETFGDYKKKIQLLDISRSKDTEIRALENEIALLKREIEDHKQCNQIKQNLDIEIERLKKDIKMYKKEISEVKRKPNLSITTDAMKNERNLPLLGSRSKFGTNENTKMNNQKSKSNSKKKQKQKSMPNNKKEEKPKTTKEKVDLKKNMYYDKLFNDEEKSAFSQYFTDTEKYEVFIKKVNVLEKCKMSIEAKYKNVVERLMDQIASLDEQIEYLNQKNKESESRLKIFHYQVNEYKYGKKVYQKKLNEYQSTAHILENQVKEKKQEINLLSHKLKSIRSQTSGNNPENNNLSSDYLQDEDNDDDDNEDEY